EDRDPVRVADRREAVRGHDRAAALEQPLPAHFRGSLGPHVHLRRRLLPDQDPGLRPQRPREPQHLPPAPPHRPPAPPARSAPPRSPPSESYPSGRRRMKSPAPIASAAASISSSSALGRPKAMFSRTLPEKRKPSWGTIPSWLRRQLERRSRRSWPSTSTRPRCGS